LSKIFPRIAFASGSLTGFIALFAELVDSILDEIENYFVLAEELNFIRKICFHLKLPVTSIKIGRIFHDLSKGRGFGVKNNKTDKIPASPSKFSGSCILF